MSSEAHVRATLARTWSGKESNMVRTLSVLPNLDALKRRMMSWRVAATTKYSCFSRSSFPSKNCEQRSGMLQDCTALPRHACA